LLVEEQRANLALYSQAILAGNWGSGQALSPTLNAATSPDGSSNATLLVENTQTAPRFVGQIIAVTNAAYTLSVFVKAKERKRIMLRDGTSETSATFDLQSGTVAGSEGSPTASIQPYGNGWYRCVMTYTPSSTSSRPYAVFLMPDTGVSFATASYTGDGASGLYLFGFQVELGAFPTSYIPTTTTAATRSADVASITGSAFSSWYRQDEGTMFVNWIRSTNVTSAGRVLLATDGTANNRNYDLRQDSSSGLTAIVVNSTSLEAGLSLSLNTLTGHNSLAFGMAANNAAASANGGAASLDNSLNIPVVNRLEIGSFVGTSFINGTIRRLTFWNQRLANSTLQTITQ
jgi:hypothetical protein